MSFAPVLPTGGLTGWRILQASYARQTAVMNATPEVSRATAHFRDRIGDAARPADLVADRRLLYVALGAFGLGDDIANKAFITRILEDGTARPEALSNRLTDQRYRDLAQSFAYDRPGPPAVTQVGFADRIVALYQARRFEEAVGAKDQNMRLALNARREIATLATTDVSDDTRWFRVLGTPPLRQVFEAVLNLPASMAQIDLDTQLGIFRDRMEARFGSADLARFADGSEADRLAEQFLLQRQVAGGAVQGGGSVALQLLRG